MKSKKFISKSMVAALSLAASISFTACGSDSESNPTSGIQGQTTNPIPVSSASQDPVIPASSATATDSGNVPVAEPRCDALIPECGYTEASLCALGITDYCTSVSSSSAIPAEETSCTNATPATFTLGEFNAIGDVYKNIQCNEKVIFMVRHGEREGFTGSASALTEDGFDAAVKAGQTMIGEGNFKYIFSGMVRTYQTALGFAAGRGEVTYTTTYAEGSDELEHFTVISPEFVADTLTQLKDGWFLKDKALRDQYKEQDSIKNENVMLAAWAYDNKYADVFYDLETRSQELLALLVKDYAAMPKYTLVASHDQVLMPLTVWATQKQIDLKLHNTTAPRNWLNYLAGIAIIIDNQNNIRYAPIKAMASGVI